MRHQRRDRRRVENASGGATEDEFANARMPVAAHHDQVGGAVGGMRQDRVRNAGIWRDDRLQFHFQTVAREVLRDLRARKLVASS